MARKKQPRKPSQGVPPEKTWRPTYGRLDVAKYSPLKIGSSCIRVETILEPFLVDGDVVLGCAHRDDPSIRVSRAGRTSTHVRTFVHEIIHHLLWDRLDEVIPKDSQENVTDQFSRGLIEFFQSNPLLARDWSKLIAASKE